MKSVILERELYAELPGGEPDFVAISGHLHLMKHGHVKTPYLGDQRSPQIIAGRGGGRVKCYLTVNQILRDNAGAHDGICGLAEYSPIEPADGACRPDLEFLPPVLAGCIVRCCADSWFVANYLTQQLGK